MRIAVCANAQAASAAWAGHPQRPPAPPGHPPRPPCERRPRQGWGDGRGERRQNFRRRSGSWRSSPSSSGSSSRVSRPVGGSVKSSANFAALGHRQPGSVVFLTTAVWVFRLERCRALEDLAAGGQWLRQRMSGTRSPSSRRCSMLPTTTKRCPSNISTVSTHGMMLKLIEWTTCRRRVIAAHPTARQCHWGSDAATETVGNVWGEWPNLQVGLPIRSMGMQHLTPPNLSNH